MARVQQGAKEEAAEATAGLGDTKEDAQHAMGLGLEANPEPGQVDLSNEASAQAHSSGSRGNKEARGGSDGSRQAEPELQHYYLDSATNMGRLIEVRDKRTNCRCRA